jgi:hypothetical protein
MQRFQKEPVLPTEVLGRYAFRAGDLAFTVDPAFGGRITAFELDGRNLLIGPDTNADNWGSTFWTSPQCDWGWPPPPEIDRLPFEASVEGETLSLMGPMCARLGVRVEKRFSFRASSGSMSITYVVHNDAAHPRKLAPWEVTRVEARGISFFPTGSEVYPYEPFLGTRDLSGITWFEYDPASLTRSQKYFADGAEGWLAHTVDNVVFVKSFADVLPSDVAPREAEIEIYASVDANPAHRYIELEQQGAYREIAPGAHLSWSVEWYARKVPAGVRVEAGSAELSDFVRTLLRPRHR